jgi:hypothetical protein
LSRYKRDKQEEEEERVDQEIETGLRKERDCEQRREDRKPKAYLKNIQLISGVKMCLSYAIIREYVWMARN